MATNDTTTEPLWCCWWWYPLTIMFLWWIQPWCLHWAMMRQGGQDGSRSSTTTTMTTLLACRFASLATALTTAVVSGTIAVAWHSHSAAAAVATPPRFVLALLYLPLGTQILRQVHMAMVGPRAFAHHFGLTLLLSSNNKNNRKDKDNFRRLCIFMWSPATVFFHVSSDNDNNIKADKIYSRCATTTISPWFDVLWTSLKDLLLMVVLCAVTLRYELYDDNPHVTWLYYHHYYYPLLQVLVRILIMGTSVAFFRVLLEVPVRFLLRHDETVRCILPVYQQPLLAGSPREFWHSWSTSVGYHLRGAFYDDSSLSSSSTMMLRTTTRTQQLSFSSSSWPLRFVRAMVTFAVNGILHIYWWSLAIKGQIDYSYIYLLGVFPLTSLFIQDVITGRAYKKPTSNKKTSWWQTAALRLVVWVGFACVAETMQVANGASLSLRDVCRSNLLLPKLPLSD